MSVKKIMVLGSGELGKEFIISAKRLGNYVIAVDSYEHAPGMQVADTFEIISMLDGNALDSIVHKHSPDIIVPEIEAIRTERFYDYEKHGIQVVPSAKAANFTMNRKSIRDLAAVELGVKTAGFRYAISMEQVEEAAYILGFPCVIKPLMSSSGKGQSIIRKKEDIPACWQYATTGGRGDYTEVIIEEFIPFDYEITLLTVTQKNGPTLFCPPIGHRQERGDYQESWQPCSINDGDLNEAQQMAEKVTIALGGYGIWGIEFFLTDKGVYFSELSPRPHDTGMVTLANTQNYNEFELHARAILGFPIPKIELVKNGASAVVLAKKEGGRPNFFGIADVLQNDNTDVKIFNKPSTRPFRRMAVVLCSDHPGTDITKTKEKAVSLAKQITLQ